MIVLCAAGTARAEEWFDAYQRGLDALRQGRASRAAEMFERAIRLRPEPGANLITYGTNRLDRYHPYLRLAEARLLAGQPEEARVALERSQARGKEPAAERARLAAQVQAALARARVAQATPAPGVPVVAPSASPSAPFPTPEAASSPVAAAAPPPASAAPSAVPMAPSPRPSAAPLAAREPPAAAASGPPPDEASAERPPAAAAAGALLIVSEPGGATIYLDDEPLGATDPDTGRLVKTGVPPGSHRVRFSRPGYTDSVRQVQVAAGAPASVRAALPPSPALGGRITVAAMGAVLGLALLAGAWAWRRRAVSAPADSRTVTLSSHGSTPPARKTAATVPHPGSASRQPAAAASSGPAEPAPFGPYVLVGVLGKGGMATVFRARRGNETFALKRPLAAYLDDPEFLQRFLREAEIGRTLHHPNIVRIHERGEVEGTPYFTMELVSGETLAALVRRSGALAPREAARVVAQVAEALDYAHLKGVVHRDLKPSNIMVLADGRVKVMDYGIARARRFEGLTLTGAFLGTPDYVAPETAEGRGTDARSDLYSLGVVFYEIVTGTKPFVADTPFATLRKHCLEPPTPPSAIAPGLPPEVERIILRLLRKDPGERYPGAEELLIELRDYLNAASGPPAQPRTGSA